MVSVLPKANLFGRKGPQPVKRQLLTEKTFSFACYDWQSKSAAPNWEIKSIGGAGSRIENKGDRHLLLSNAPFMENFDDARIARRGLERRTFHEFNRTLKKDAPFSRSKFHRLGGKNVWITDNI